MRGLESGEAATRSKHSHTLVIFIRRRVYGKILMYVRMCIEFSFSALLCGENRVHLQHFAARNGVGHLAQRLDQEVG
jgi:hypothetical protein